jgi:pimeloyl-ACP methyl ester carboxylesterase
MIQMAGGVMSVLDIGDPDRPVDLIWCHATGFNAQTYWPALLPLGGKLRILAVDQRGHGRTTLPADPERLTSWRLYADDLVALIAAEGIKHPVTLAGHSMGGTAALIVADRLGAQAKSLVLFDPVIVPQSVYWLSQVPALSAIIHRKNPMAANALRRRAVFASRDAAFETYRSRSALRTWPDDALRAYVEGGFDDAPDGVTLSCTPEWEATTFRGATSVNLWPILARLTVPLHILRAGRHSTCAVREGQRLSERANRTVETIAGTTHFLPLERPDILQAAMLSGCDEFAAATL